MEICESGNTKLMSIDGSANDEQCFEAWEQLIQDNDKAKGLNRFNAYMSLSKAYARLIATLNEVKIYLIKLSYTFDKEIVNILKQKGYKVDCSNSDAYALSLQQAFSKSDNLITKIVMKRNEILAMGANTGTSAIITVEDLLATISSQLGFSVDENVTLARYNKYCSIISKQQKDGRRGVQAK